MRDPLQQAAVLIEAYIETLNAAQSRCDCCGMIKYDDFPAYQARVELTAMVRKLRRHRPG